MVENRNFWPNRSTSGGGVDRPSTCPGGVVTPVTLSPILRSHRPGPIPEKYWQTCPIELKKKHQKSSKKPLVAWRHSTSAPKIIGMKLIRWGGGLQHCWNTGSPLGSSMACLWGVVLTLGRNFFSVLVRPLGPPRGLRTSQRPVRGLNGVENWFAGKHICRRLCG